MCGSGFGHVIDVCSLQGISEIDCDKDRFIIDILTGQFYLYLRVFFMGGEMLSCLKKDGKITEITYEYYRFI